ncbi:dimethylarginine dimethylaminohydrolase family protein [Marmoricola sp. RAF53]|uniref:dimethylarginine dimethylaminohydrolase family protein n=1 Tax=Marmoricola sp. RAF53 TaxID=3233059 RepID=UPI003F955CC9
MGEQLTWGREYLMVAPDHFRVEYAINPFMDLSTQPDPVTTRAQWDAIIAGIEAAGGAVEVLGQRQDSPDMVYAMNLGLPFQGGPGTVGRTAVLSHMRYAERRNETETAEQWFRDHEFATVSVGAQGVGAHFEAGDAFAWRGDLVVGFGPRTERLALKHLATELDVRVQGLEIVHPGMYHLDLSFCPLDSERAMVCPAAFTEASARQLLDLVPEALVLSEEEAMSFCANSIVIGRTILMPACPDRVRAQLEAWDFEVVIVGVEEFVKGGGAIRCLTNPLDVTLGRDLRTGEAKVVSA